MDLQKLPLSPAAMATVASGGSWYPQKHHVLVDRELVKLVYRQVSERILLVEEPPRHGKSEHISRWLPCWHVCRWPDKQVGLASYESDFARTWGRKARESFLEVGPHFGLKVDRRRDAANEWGPMGHTGGMFTAGVGGPFTGRGFHIVIVDDPIKNAEDALSERFREKLWAWFQSTVQNRLEPNGVIVVMQTRWHSLDLVGRLLKRAEDGGEAVRRITLPAIAGEDDQLGRQPGEALWPQRWPIEEMERVKKSLEPYWWLAQYQQQPSQHEHSEWPDSYFKDCWARMIPDPENIAYRVIFLDPSLGRTDKSDYSAFVTLTVMDHGLIYVEGDLERRDLVQIADDAIDHCRQVEPVAMGVEVNGFHALKELIQQRAGGVGLPLASITQHKNKLARIRLGVGPLLAAKRLKFLEGALGTKLLVDQLKDFPLADHDDGPDALEGALRLARAVDAGEHLAQPETARVVA